MSALWESEKTSLDKLFKFAWKSEQDISWMLTYDKLTDVSAGPAYYIDNNLELQTINSTSPLWVDGKLWQMGSWTQYLANPTAPATQTTASLAIGTYYLWIYGSGSAAVSAGTATITGAGTSTQSSHVKFAVTVAGTVTVTVFGSVLFFQLANIQPTPFFNPTATTVLSRAGTSYCDMSIGTKNYKLLEALSGKVSGENIVPNGDFSEGSTGWTLGTSWSVENGVLIGFGGNGLSYASNRNLSPLDLGYLYEIRFETIENTLNGNGLGFSDGDVFHTSPIYYNRVGKNCVRRLSDSGNSLIFFISGLATLGQIKIKNFLVKKVTIPVVSKITFDWQPYYDSTDATVAQIIFKTASKTIAFDAMSGIITLSDGTNTATVSLTSWTAKTTIKFKMLCGDNHPGYPCVNKMQICASKDGGVTWINSSVVDFNGSMIKSGDTKFYHGGGTLPQAVSNVKAWTLKSGDWPS